MLKLPKPNQIKLPRPLKIAPPLLLPQTILLTRQRRPPPPNCPSNPLIRRRTLPRMLEPRRRLRQSILPEVEPRRRRRKSRLSLLLARWRGERRPPLTWQDWWKLARIKAGWWLRWHSRYWGGDAHAREGGLRTTCAGAVFQRSSDTGQSWHDGLTRRHLLIH